MNLLLLCTVKKGDFPLAEWNEISGKCFSLTPLGPGDGFRSCDVLFFVAVVGLTWLPEVCEKLVWFWFYYGL